MIILNTDHLTVYANAESLQYHPLRQRLLDSGEELATTAVNLEEQLRGWLAVIHRRQKTHDQVHGYDRLLGVFDYAQFFRRLRFDESAADEYERLRGFRIRVGPMDLKIASIALVHRARLLSNNLRDFRRVPGLRVESWLDEGDED